MNCAVDLMKITLSCSVSMSVGRSAVGSYLCVCECVCGVCVYGRVGRVYVCVWGMGCRWTHKEMNSTCVCVCVCVCACTCVCDLCVCGMYEWVGGTCMCVFGERGGRERMSSLSVTCSLAMSVSLQPEESLVS